MGLDIYLSHYDDFKKSHALEKKYETKSEAIWKKVGGNKKYDQLTEEQKNEARQLTDKLKQDLGLGEYGEDVTYQQKVENDSKLHPEHMFKIGYFRSSYNDGGIERVLGKMSLPTLHDIFPHKDDEYEFSPNWQESLRLVNHVLVAFNHESNGFNGKFDCFDVAATNLFNGPAPVRNEAAALKIFKNELETNKSGFSAYSNRAGHFYGEALKVRGLIEGINCLGQPCLYVVTEREKTEDGEDGLKWYKEALEVVRETIEFVLAQKDPQNYYLRWSG